MEKIKKKFKFLKEEIKNKKTGITYLSGVKNNIRYSVSSEDGIYFLRANDNYIMVTDNINQIIQALEQLKIGKTVYPNLLAQQMQKNKIGI